MQCAYRSKFCDAPRATKLDGTLHKLCDFHRHKANANQQRLHRRKKRFLEQQQQQQQAAATTADSPTSDIGGSCCSPSKRARGRPTSPRSTTEPVDSVTLHNGFNLLEVKILEVLLFGSEGATWRPAPPTRVQMDDDERTVFEAPASGPPTALAPVPLLDSVWSVTL
ncbi:unnamed protein product [Hyaloperonospora brassicae]|uniref:SBP-type domain-containing protein n=1 Tax=Hyaloperonospora brassicae TaxID=162125 RepID=A0AAV0UNA0_HYABA|nr:unnamed protein product [Hyaloperonospora brassicae]